jgi:hypothetical protein
MIMVKKKMLKTAKFFALPTAVALYITNKHLGGRLVSFPNLSKGWSVENL